MHMAGGGMHRGGGGMHVHPVHPPWVRHCRDVHPGSRILIFSIPDLGSSDHNSTESPIRNTDPILVVNVSKFACAVFAVSVSEGPESDPESKLKLCKKIRIGQKQFYETSFSGARFTCHNLLQKLVGLLLAENFHDFLFLCHPPFFLPTPALRPLTLPAELTTQNGVSRIESTTGKSGGPPLVNPQSPPTCNYVYIQGSPYLE
jgi:hypothetical protein